MTSEEPEPTSRPRERYGLGDALRGERIAFTARKVVQRNVVHGSSRHRAVDGSLDNAFCVIEKPLRQIPQA